MVGEGEREGGETGETSKVASLKDHMMSSSHPGQALEGEESGQREGQRIRKEGEGGGGGGGSFRTAEERRGGGRKREAGVVQSVEMCV